MPAWAVVIGLTAAIVAPSQAQLLSPGELSEAHQELEGVTNCTSCHTIGGKGVDEQKCLDCHEPIRDRVASKRGLHGALSDPCVACHKDHLGRNFNVVRFDTLSFDHKAAGYDLLGAHANINCVSCHRPDHIADKKILEAVSTTNRQTFLGLSGTCTSCHGDDSPHGTQFAGRECSSCHESNRWRNANLFSHDSTSFVLTGSHKGVECRNCHPDAANSGQTPKVQFEGIAFAQCSDCHNDPHKQSFGAGCNTCHTTSGWSNIAAERSFEHRATGFALLGAHATVSCASCHRKPARSDSRIRMTFLRDAATKRYPPIESSTCASCHVDYHDGIFGTETTSCDGCHDVDVWVPTSYDIRRHNQESRFALTGAHLSVTCAACHRTDGAHLGLRFEDLSCFACHAKDNPHGTQFDRRMEGQSCASCHNAQGWSIDVDFDHTATKFPLEGAHAFLACSACHVPSGEINLKVGLDYTGLETTCSSCHGSDNPHGDQFAGRDCGTCHETSGQRWAATRFDHSSTRFVLDGAHQRLKCAQCHTTESAPDGALITRFSLGSKQCVDCHSTE